MLFLKKIYLFVYLKSRVTGGDGQKGRVTERDRARARSFRLFHFPVVTMAEGRTLGLSISVSQELSK